MEWVCQKILLYISVNYFFIVKHKYPGAKKFCYKPSAIIAELETLFSRVLGTGSSTWSSNMNDLPEVGSISSIFETYVPNDTSIEVEDDYNRSKTLYQITTKISQV